ncbi:MAG: FHA domain-containing protein [Verrucomicrobiota bacterium]
MESKKLLDLLHAKFARRESGSVRFECDGIPTSIVLNYGDIETIDSPHYSEGCSVQEIIQKGISNVQFTRFKDTAGVPVEMGTEMLLFSMAAAVDQHIAGALERTKSQRIEHLRTKTQVDDFKKQATQTESVKFQVSDGQNQQVFILGEGESSIGRSTECDVSIAEPTLSRKHAVITVDDGKATIEDLGTANGTYINRRPVDRTIELTEECVLTFAQISFRFFWSECNAGVLFQIGTSEVREFEDGPTTIIPRQTLS